VFYISNDLTFALTKNGEAFVFMWISVCLG